MRINFEARQRLIDVGVKPSLHRMAVMEYLMMNRVHPTADMVYSNLYNTIPTLSKTTVYNVLKLLEERGALRSVYVDEKNVRYDADLTDHAHFKCVKCGAVRDLKLYRPLESGDVEVPSGMDLGSCQIYFRGVCDKCKHGVKAEDNTEVKFTQCVN
ncbi:MAG: transcriptional repressor [Tannerella sp.]|jgi:Fur family ferric uptake transcriptional regulator/Fur family peroxide stress response transcriptional regulator|nr:transcriptional repressor [Tannerella sp.]